MTLDNGQTEPVAAKLAFEAAPCQCVGSHSPLSKGIELHHPYPQGEQKKRYGKVVDNRTVALCPTAHGNVHLALAARLKGKDFRLGNRYQESIVAEGLRRIREG